MIVVMSHSPSLLSVRGHPCLNVVSIAQPSQAFGDVDHREADLRTDGLLRVVDEPHSTPEVGNGSRLCKNAILVGRVEPDRQSRFHARIAFINQPTPFRYRRAGTSSFGSEWPPSRILSCQTDAPRSGGVRASYSGSDRAAPAQLQGRLRAPNVRSVVPCLLCTCSSVRSPGKQWSNSDAASYPLLHW